jgi:streptomycin 6-kinase
MVVVPPAFAAWTIDREGDAGRAWIERLPTLVEAACTRWDLSVDGSPTHGNVALVVPVRAADGTAAMLKVSWVEDETEHEALALRSWAGVGAVQLLAATADDPGGSDAGIDPDRTLLLERLHGDRTLLTVADHEAATVAAAEVLARLHVAPVPGLRSLADIAARWVEELPAESALLGHRLPRSLLDAAVATCRELGPDHTPVLLHGDFHYENVLAADRAPWLAIDPKPVAGDPGFDVVALFWNRWEELVATGDAAAAVRRRFDVAVEVAGIDRERARRWSITRAVDNILWAGQYDRTDWSAVQRTIAEALAAAPPPKSAR